MEQHYTSQRHRPPFYSYLKKNVKKTFAVAEKAEFMIRTHNRPLKETPDVLNSIGADTTPYPFLGTMVDSLMPSVVVSNTPISRPVVSINSRLTAGGKPTIPQVKLIEYSFH